MFVAELAELLAVERRGHWFMTHLQAGGPAEW